MYFRDTSQTETWVKSLPDSWGQPYPYHFKSNCRLYNISFFKKMTSEFLDVEIGRKYKKHKFDKNFYEFITLEPP